MLPESIAGVVGGSCDEDDDSGCSSSDPSTVSDLTKLDEITLDSVVACLHQRYMKGEYCTFAGSVLLMLNPCTANGSPSDEASMSTSKRQRHSVGQGLFGYDAFRDVLLNSSKAGNGKCLKDPHALSFGIKSLNNIRSVGNDQVIVVSGDTGAGKTTCTQNLIKFFTYANGHDTKDDFSSLQKQVYEATLVLEALGNASTLANSNSSRFGRLVELKYDENGKILGAEIKTYMLEKYRVAKVNSGERNFHIFHYLHQATEAGYFEGLAKEVFQGKLWSQNISDSDRTNFLRLNTALVILDLLNEFKQVFNYLFAILHLLMLDFQKKQDNKENQRQRSHYAVSDNTRLHLSSACRHLGIKDEELETSLTFNFVSAGNRKSISKSPVLRREECEVRLHTFVSMLYEKLFSFIVDTLNNILLRNAKGLDGNGKDRCPSISILDLYGFENLACNQFEQLCINYANERVHQIQMCVLKRYFEDQIDNSVNDSEELVELGKVEQEIHCRITTIHLSVFDTLDEACLLKRTISDDDIWGQISLKSQEKTFVTTEKRCRENHQFIIHHYAGHVKYSANGMIVKNKDFIPEEYRSVLKRSTNVFVSGMFTEAMEQIPTAVARNKGGVQKTILTRFKKSVNELVRALCDKDDRDVHFIKCIKPNSQLLPGIIDQALFTNQLASCGVIDIIRVSSSGYSIKISLIKLESHFPVTMKRFCLMSPLNSDRFERMFSTTKKSLKFGRAHIFMDGDVWEKLCKIEKYCIHRSARVIQRGWKNYVTVKNQPRLENTAPESPNSYCTVESLYSTPMSSMNPLHDQYSAFEEELCNLDEDDVKQSTMLIHNASGDTFERPSPSSSLFRYTEDIFEQSMTMTILEDRAMEISPSPSPRRKPTPLRMRCKVTNLFQWNRIVSRRPLQTVPIKLYTKKTALGYIRPPPALKANGIQDAINDYGIIFQ